MAMQVTILGCGASGGVPTIGGVWGNCNPDNPKNRRRRVSVFIEVAGRNILIDCGPDLREQLNDLGTTKVDAVLLTHAHADHIMGIDDLQRLYWHNGKQPMPMFLSAEALDELKRRFDYIFAPIMVQGKPERLPPFAPTLIQPGRFTVQGVEVAAIAQHHKGEQGSLGFRIGDFAYSTDVKALDDAAFAALHGVKLWVVDMQRERESYGHSHLAQTLAWIERVKPERAIFTHMDSETDYDEIKAKCPTGVEPAYDGMVLTL